MRVTALLAADILVLLGLLGVTPRCRGADVWGGSVALTSDYLVRGVSRSNDRAALQLDIHYLDASGLVAGLFASSTQIDPGEPKDAELSAFLGFAWPAGFDWGGKIIASHYAYPWNRAGSLYDYDELDLDVSYREWLDLHVTYSPDTPLYVPSRGFVRSAAESAEANVQHRVVGKLFGATGIGYAHFGSGPGGYAYGSIGAVYNLAPVVLTVSYVDTTAEAKSLFYNAVAGGRWTGTVIWRF